MNCQTRLEQLKPFCKDAEYFLQVSFNLLKNLTDNKRESVFLSFPTSRLLFPKWKSKLNCPQIATCPGKNRILSLNGPKPLMCCQKFIYIYIYLRPNKGENTCVKLKPLGFTKCTQAPA